MKSQEAQANAQTGVGGTGSGTGSGLVLGRNEVAERLSKELDSQYQANAEALDRQRKLAQEKLTQVGAWGSIYIYCGYCVYIVCILYVHYNSITVYLYILNYIYLNICMYIQYNTYTHTLPPPTGRPQWSCPT